MFAIATIKKSIGCITFAIAIHKNTLVLLRVPSQTNGFIAFAIGVDKKNFGFIPAAIGINKKALVLYRLPSE